MQHNISIPFYTFIKAIVSEIPRTNFAMHKNYFEVVYPNTIVNHKDYE